MCQKRFIAEHNIWKKKKNLENTKETIVDFKRRMSIEVRRQKKLEGTKE